MTMLTLKFTWEFQANIMFYLTLCSGGGTVRRKCLSLNPAIYYDFEL